MFHKNKKGSILRSTGTVFYSLLYLNSRQGFNGLKYLYSIFSVKIDSLPANTKNRESTRSWTARVRFLHPWANLSEKSYQECAKKKCHFWVHMYQKRLIKNVQEMIRAYRCGRKNYAAYHNNT